MIKRLKDTMDGWVERNDSLKPLVLDYFVSLFTSEAGDTDQGLLASVKPSVSAAMNDFLCVDYTGDEVKRALFQIEDVKAPGTVSTLYSSRDSGIYLVMSSPKRFLML